MRTELVSEPGDSTRPNEDFAAVALPASGQGGALVVLDGVTPPRDETGCLHSVPWYVARLGGALTELTVSLPDVPLPQTLSRAIARTAEAHADTCDLSHPRTPQATVVVARWGLETVEYLVLSDSALLLESSEGSVTAVLDDRLSRLPRTALATDALVDSTIRNKEGGFFTAAADPSVAERAVTGALPRGEVRALAALTDGATRWVEKFREGDWSDCLRFVRKEGAGALVERVRTLETADTERVFLRRSKTHDDATVVHVEL
ncbi:MULTISPECIES: protein phosphatase 2C domain-containing protein [unclassified Streptomyces]|uniref:protein phosphatase 2C domain-containing protein n=1 Tax=unclassified Streptomyces TaxID=2593676 RepID=UPI0022521B60|nr:MULTISPECIES: protein phosphatase 2C domain-containing protein [unclassified Streptomyces]MCX5051010.1 protein phosphatase 2C domain-containing protein [Streptomyces sp. NBC_00474]MCX5061366.1 protein phosphatase 2C domain-containing protein [Streptomyces sp. NBC_00452]MCX5293006.1 protein phosphatase 2C domain-containing protein [Streptomyces sp. NBC_00183]